MRRTASSPRTGCSSRPSTSAPTYTCSASAVRLLDGRRRWSSTTSSRPRARSTTRRSRTTGRSRSSGRAASPARAQLDVDRRRRIRSGSPACRPGQQALRLRLPGRRQVPRQRPRLLRRRDHRGRRHREPDLGDALQHDRRLVRRAVAVGLRRDRPGPARSARSTRTATADQAVMYGPKFNTRTQATYNAALTTSSQRQGRPAADPIGRRRALIARRIVAPGGRPTKVCQCPAADIP